MNKTILLVIGLVVLAAVGFFIVKGQSTPKTDTMVKPSDAMMEVTGTPKESNVMMEK